MKEDMPVTALASSAASLGSVDLGDKYRLETGSVYLSGTQALVRLLVSQRRRDARRGLDTAGLVSGYRGSPLGGYDLALWQAHELLAAHAIRFEPGVNEELAATMIWGTQQTDMFGGSRHDGVFGLWYAKNPGLDRAADALKHANAAGTAANGGVLAVVGDDPGASSSSLPNQCEHAFISAMIPVLAPAGVGEFVDFGLYGLALSRFSGLWVGFKAVADLVESSAVVTVDDGRPDFVRPAIDPPPGGLHGRWPDDRWSMDARLQRHRLPAALAFAAANSIDRRSHGAAGARLGIVAAGKAWADVAEALAELGLDDSAGAGVAVYKVGQVWPLEPGGLRSFAEGLEEILVVEERRPVLESQIKEQAYCWPTDRRPRVVGKADETGAPLLPSTGELDPALVATVIVARLAALGGVPAAVAERAVTVASRRARPAPVAAPVARVAHFCAGCPHARSTQLPAGSTGLAGIGCHSLVIWMAGRHTVSLTHMGGEGANWVGAAPFAETGHMFQNMGDGTYVHSGQLAIRQAVAAGTNITFKILLNDATAMTGGQPVEGALTAARLSRQLAAEGVERIAVVSDDPSAEGFAPGATRHRRQQLNEVQKELRGWPGVSALIFEQVCATEKRRRRKRGEAAMPAVRPVIHPLVCEGCGDCGEVSGGCVAVQPLDTPFGRKRQIDPSACNIDLSCLEGACPALVTVEGGRPRRPAAAAARFELPDPPAAPLADSWDLLVAGVGGSGVITVGALLGMAAHLEGKGVSVLDNTGLARKGGAVTTHVRLTVQPDRLHAPRIAAGKAALVLGCDLVVAAAAESLSKIDPGRTRVVINDHPNPTAAQLANPDGAFDADGLCAVVTAVAGERAVERLDAARLAAGLVGDAIFANVLLLGYAFQRGLIPLGWEALERAIELNGTAAADNRAAFAWGRRAAADPAAVQAALQGSAISGGVADATLAAIVERRADYLEVYQNRALAARYRALVERAVDAERHAVGSAGPLAAAVARNWFRLLAVKDEYEVARLLSDPSFHRELGDAFEGPFAVAYHLAPPLLAGTRDDGRPRKRRFGPWGRPLLAGLARLAFLRGTPFDPFGHTRERRLERRLAAVYLARVEELMAGLTAERHALAVEIAELPAAIRGYGAVKLRHAEAAERLAAELMARWRDPQYAPSPEAGLVRPSRA
jgi:indolepyruvate ferredoxin oxidoreductase